MTLRDSSLGDVQAEPLSTHIGAVLRGEISLSGNPDNTTLAVIRAALAQRLVIVIDDQDLSSSALRDLTSHFGPPHIHHEDEGVLYADGIREVLEMRKEPGGTRLFGGESWHADVTFTNRPPTCRFSMPRSSRR